MMNCQFVSDLLLFKQRLFLLWQATFKWFQSRVLSLIGTLQKNSLFFPLLVKMHVQPLYEDTHVFVSSRDTMLTFWAQKICFPSTFRFREHTTIFFHKIYRNLFQIRNYFGSRYSLCISYTTFHLVIQLTDEMRLRQVIKPSVVTFRASQSTTHTPVIPPEERRKPIYFPLKIVITK